MAQKSQQRKLLSAVDTNRILLRKILAKALLWRLIITLTTVEFQPQVFCSRHAQASSTIFSGARMDLGLKDSKLDTKRAVIKVGLTQSNF